MKQSNSLTFHESTTSICSVCQKRIPAKIVLKDNGVFILKTCSEHGSQLEILEEDAEYHLSKRRFDKPGTQSITQTQTNKGCPYDCGLCTEHDQHTCIGLLEITNQCNLKCPVCYADSGKEEYLSLESIDQILDFFVESENGDAEILQISGGEPTLHPNLFKIIDLAMKKNIRFVMVNTNGIKFAEDPEFFNQLKPYESGFEIYLQFDGFKESTHKHFRGKDVRDIKRKAIDNLLEKKIPITLVSTIEEGINDDEIGKIIEFGMETDGIRGINFQPVAYFGRNGSAPSDNRITLSGIIKRIENQLGNTFHSGDIVPLPCNVERVAVSYLIRKNGIFEPITRKVKVDSYLPVIDNTFAFDIDKFVGDQMQNIRNELQLCDCFKLVKDIHNLIPKNYFLKNEKGKKKYIDENTFRISVTSFVDRFNFDMKSIQKECVHVLTPDKKRIPFSAYNMFYRE
jgi:uncharacterized radical SAM superfamily Fe-S cluster-containing enzyme